MEFRKTIFQAWIVMENSKGHGESWKVMEKLLGAHQYYYNQLELILLILVCIHMSCFVYFRDVNFVFFPEIDFRFEKIDFFSIIEFWFCASLTVGLLMLQSHYVLART